MPTIQGATEMKITTMGIDLAKNVIHVHGVDERGKAVVGKKQFKRSQVTLSFANLPLRRISVEACASAHHWARKLQGFGHTVKLMAPQFVKAYVKKSKTDVAIAEATCEAVSRPTIRIAPIRNAEQQAVSALHRARQEFVRVRTAQANQILGLMVDYGIVIPQGIDNIAKWLPDILEDGENELSGTFRQLLDRLANHLKALDRQVGELEAEIHLWHRDNKASNKLATIPGISLITASVLVGSIGEAKTLENGRHFAAWLGLVPREYSSGGKQQLLGICKLGDTSGYPADPQRRSHAAIRVVERKAQRTDCWLARLIGRHNKNMVAVTLANKNARTVQVLLSQNRHPQHDYEFVAP